MFVEVTAPAVAEVAGRAAPARPSATRRLAAALPPYLYLLPALAGVAIWIYRPVVQTVQLSFYDWNLLPTTPITPAGWANFQQLLTLPELHAALLNTLWYVLGLLPFSVLLPLGIALATQRIRGRGSEVYRALVFVPVLVTPLVTAAVWRWLLSPSGGIVNQGLEALGAGPVNFFRDPQTALPAIIGITGWQMLGFSVLIISAGLAGINRDYYAAAQLDGASSGQILRMITLPLLSPSLLFMVLMTVLLGSQWAFPLIDVLTQGGPGTATTNLYYLLYQFGFQNFNVGVSAAAATLFFLFFGVIALACVRLIDRYSFYDN